MKRYALISIKGSSRDQIARYLPANYEIIAEVERANALDDSDYEGCFGPCVVIAGRDNAGWTLDGYVLPRLANGLHVGREIDLSHPVMKTIPDCPVHKAAPQVTDEYHCAVCGQAIRRVPCGQGAGYVHSDSGAVAAPNPPVVA